MGDFARWIADRDADRGWPVLVRDAASGGWFSG